MKRSSLNVLSLNLLLSAVAIAPAKAADPVTANGSSDTSYGLFNTLDHRSAYGQGAFPEPFLNDDSDLEVNEFRLDWVHTKGPDARTDEMTVELEKGFGALTVELELHYVRETSRVDGSLTHGFDNIDVAARYPLFQFVSPNEFFDNTFGAGVEVGIPPCSPISRNAELVPKIFDDLRLGEHFTLQSIAGYSIVFASGSSEADVHVFEYGVTLGYTFPHKELPIPGVLQFVPVFELAGETQLNLDESGDNSLTGFVGFRADCKSIGKVQPRLGVGYMFPIDNGARAELTTGVFTSLVFEF